MVKNITALEVCFDSPLVRNGPLGAPAFVKLAHWLKIWYTVLIQNHHRQRDFGKSVVTLWCHLVMAWHPRLKKIAATVMARARCCRRSGLALVGTARYQRKLEQPRSCRHYWTGFMMTSSKHFPRSWSFMRGIHRSPVFSQSPWTLIFDVFFDLRVNKMLIKLSRRRWFETPSC